MSPRQGKVRLRRFAAAGACALLVAIAGVAPASADEWSGPTTQAVAYNADWVPYLDPPEKPAAVCLVDSGVAITPDTPADSPTGPIVKRLALDGGPGTEAGASWPGMHGTRMAFVGAAPVNGWGAVGFWPGARVVSIRAMAIADTDFPFDSYARAVGLCTKQATSLNIVAVNLSLSCSCSPTPDEVGRLDEQIAKAHNNGESVVAAAGNNASEVGHPANQSGVVGVAAGDRNGALCAFSNRGETVDLTAPGCDLDLADPNSGALWSAYESGTSGAAMTASVTLALLRSYRPELGWAGAEQLLLRASQGGTSASAIDVERLFRDAGLSPLVDKAKSHLPAGNSLGSFGPGDRDANPTELASGSDTPDVTSSRTRTRLPKPRLDSFLKLGHRLTIAVSNRPPTAELAITIMRRRGKRGYRTITIRRASSDVLTMRVSKPQGALARLGIRYTLPREPSRTSRPLYQQVRL